MWGKQESPSAITGDGNAVNLQAVTALNEREGPFGNTIWSPDRLQLLPSLSL